MERDAAKALPNDQLLEILSTVPASTVAKLTERLTYINEKVAAFKTASNSEKMIATLEKSLAGAKKSGNDSMVEILTKQIEAGVNVPEVAAKAVTDIDIAKAYIEIGRAHV